MKRTLSKDNHHSITSPFRHPTCKMKRARTTCLMKIRKKLQDLRLLIHTCVNHWNERCAWKIKIKQDNEQDLKPWLRSHMLRNVKGKMIYEKLIDLALK